MKDALGQFPLKAFSSVAVKKSHQEPTEPHHPGSAIPTDPRGQRQSQTTVPNNIQKQPYDTIGCWSATQPPIVAPLQLSFLFLISFSLVAVF